YSHSNWVELGQKGILETGTGFWDPLLPFSRQKGVMMIEGENDDVPAGYSLSRSGAVVTVTTPGGPVGGVISGFYHPFELPIPVPDDCPDSVAMPHGELNKDLPDK